MKIGLVGKPNVGKSTFFKAATLKDVAIADYPFTTIDPNHGIGYARTRCPHVEFQTPCNPQHGACLEGTRFVPVELVDVAGLVPGAHEGRGRGNQFLDDLRQADALIHIVDASGATDEEGRPVAPGTRDPLDDVRFLDEETTWWIEGILAGDWDRMFKKVHVSGEKLEALLAQKLTGLGLTEKMMHAALREGGTDRRGLARAVRKISKPILVAFNKADKVPKARVDELTGRLGGTPAQATAADAEVALRGAAKAGLIHYVPGGAAFEFAAGGSLNPRQQQALEYIRAHVLGPYGTTGVVGALERVAFDMLQQIVVFPVEDDHKLTDKRGNVLPDAHLVPQGATARDLAFRVHTDLGKSFIRAVDARTRRVIGAEHPLKNGDVVRIVANA